MMDRYEYAAPAMGTYLKIVLYAKNEFQAQGWISNFLQEIERLSQVLNNYSNQSEISKLNGNSGNRTLVSEDLYRILEHSKRWFELSDGAFDVTSGALFAIWKAARKSGRLPTKVQWTTARGLCGLRTA
jgi:thiamine biosynthesis lipoprotein